MNRIVLFLALISTSCNSFGQWTQCNGPYGGYVTCLEQNQVTNTLFAGTLSNNLFRFKSNVGHWTELTNKVPTPDQSINDLGVVDSVLYVSTSYGLFKTTDDGDTWLTVFTDSIYNGFSSNIYCRDSILIFFGAARNIFVSTNWGNSFSEVSVTFPDTLYAYFDVTMMGDRIFVLHGHIGDYMTVSYSDDFGQTWNKPLIDLNSSALWFTKFQVFGNVIYALGEDTLRASNDTGLTWHTVSTPGITYPEEDELFISGDTVLIAHKFNGLYISTDGGNSFNQCSNGMPLIKNQVTQIFKTKSNSLIASTSLGVFISTNIGANWSEISDKINATNANCLTALNNEIFLGTKIQGVFVTSDSGNSFIRKSSGLEFFTYFQRIIDMTACGNRLIAGTDNEIYYSDNNGTSWNHSNINPNEIDHLECTPTKLFAGTSAGIYSSNDNGITWNKLLNGPGCNVPGLIVKDNLIIGEDACNIPIPPYFTTEIMRSDDFGATFTTVNSSFTFVDIEMIDSLVLASNWFGWLAKSTDLGITWNLDSTTFGQVGIPDIYIVDSKFIFIGTTDGKIYLSKDTAKTWIDLTDNFIGYISEFLVFNSTLYVATATSGVWKRSISKFIGDSMLTTEHYNFLIYPNPTNGNFTLTIPDDFKNDQNLILKIYDDIGRLVKQISLNTSHNVFNLSLSNESVGLYYLTLTGDSGNYISKIIRTN